MTSRPSAWRTALANTWALWRPADPTANLREQLRVVVGALLGIALTAWLSHLLLPGLTPWLVAPMGASAVLVFGVPNSPLAQPWAVVGGNSLSALVGVACAQNIPHLAVAGGCAVAGAIAVMFALRCLHPPGGASALYPVLAGPAVAKLGYGFPLMPVLVNAVALVAFGVLYNTVTRRPYPHRQRSAAPTPAEAERPGFTSGDLDAVLRRHNGLIDIARDELEGLLREAELQAHRRRLGQRSVAAVARRDLPTVAFSTPLAEAWALLRPGGVKALAVVNRFQRVEGIVTRADFLRLANLDVHEGLADRLRRHLRASGHSHSERPEVVGQVMQAKPVCAQADAHALDLVDLFARSGHRHLPVVDARGVYQGMVAQADLIEALTEVLTDGSWAPTPATPAAAPEATP